MTQAHVPAHVYIRVHTQWLINTISCIPHALGNSVISNVSAMITTMSSQVVYAQDNMHHHAHSYLSTLMNCNTNSFIRRI